MENKNKIAQRAIKIKIVGLLIGLVFLALPSISKAASLFVSPNSGSYTVGQSFSVGIYVTSSDQPMNAVSGILSYPTDKLQVNSVSKSGSIIGLWAQEPSYSNSAGTATFEGIILNPGWQGSSGRVLTVTFTAKTAGTANIRFTSSSVLANDGLGTAILQSIGTGSYGIDVKTDTPPPTGETPPVTAGTPPSPDVRSSTHPDQDKWYAKSSADFNWDITGMDAVRLLVGDKPQATPIVDYVPAISSKTITELEDGTWYFHVRLRNKQGWGGITHFRFNIDTTKPDKFVMNQIVRTDPTDPIAAFVLEASDATSGIDHYEIQLDNNDIVNWIDDGSHTYRTNALLPGKHNIIVKAVDGAGNFIVNFADFTIEPIDSPVITEYPKALTNTDPFMVKGTTYPGSQVLIWLQRERDEASSFVVASDSDGSFSFVADHKLDDGVYKLWAETIDQRGAHSLPTEPLKVVVSKPSWIKFGNIAIDFLAVAIPLIALVFLLFTGVTFMWYKLKNLRRRVGRETSEASSALHSEFHRLRGVINSNVATMERAGKRRKLSREETRLLNSLKKEMAAAERKVGKEIKDISDQL